MMSDKSHLKILAISRLATSSCNKSCKIKSFLSFHAFCRAALKQCRSSVSKTFKASGQFSETRQPNCSSVINRSNKTKSGFKALINSSKLSSFSLMLTFSIPSSFKSNIKSLSEAALAKVIFQPFFKKL